MTPDFEVAVIGAGVVGLAITRELALAGKSVLVLETEGRAGTQTSSRNSEVIHAGIYYPTGSLKAKLCVQGRHLLYDYCASHGIAALRLGKLIVASTAAEEPKLESIKALATANGVNDLQWLSAEEARGLEPELLCTKALLSPSTGIVDAGAYMLSLLGIAEAAGATFAFNTKFMGARQQDGHFVLRTQDAEITTNALVNAAGHGAHEAARAISNLDPRRLPPQYFARGSYCSVSGKSPFKRLVYPVPVPGGLGIHATLDLGGAVRFGPNVEWISWLDYSLSDNLPEVFTAAIKHYWPDVANRTLTPSYCGIRPKIHSPRESFADFCIQTAKDHGVANLINLFGIESPGLTASLAIARMVSGHLDQGTNP